VIYNDVKSTLNIKEVIIIDHDEPTIGCLVRSVTDENSTGMIIELLPEDEVMILWSTSPRSIQKNREIW